MLVGFMRDVLEHPLTWLIVALIIIAGIVVKKIDRRPLE